MDKRFLEFVGSQAAPLKKQLATGRGDGVFLAWIAANAKFKGTELEIAQWSAYVEMRVPTDPETREYFNAQYRKYGPKREDIATFVDLLDLDDYVSLGGKGEAFGTESQAEQNARDKASKLLHFSQVLSCLACSGCGYENK